MAGTCKECTFSFLPLVSRLAVNMKKQKQKQKKKQKKNRSIVSNNMSQLQT